jgi:hypothetical protein
VLVGREHRLAARTTHDVEDLLTVRRHDAALGDAETAGALEDADDQRHPTEEAQRLAGKPRGAQSSRDDGEDLHQKIRGADATFTPLV